MNRPRRGAMLVELVASLLVAAILAAGLAAALRVLSRSMDRTGNATGSASRTTQVLDRISADLSVAQQVSEQTARSICFTVADRNGDGLSDTIRYAWSGTAGDPLTVEYNGGQPMPILEKVTHFNLSYLARVLGPPPPREGEEQILCSYTVKPNASFNTKNTTWPAEFFQPTLPPNAISWKITRLEVMMKRLLGATGTVSAQIRTVDAAKKPTGTILASSTVNVSTIATTNSWVKFPLADPLAGLSCGASYALVVTASSGSNAVAVAYNDKVSPTSPQRLWTTTTNSGGSWSTPVSNRSMDFRVYGTITTQGL